jgi:hypothetical protein
METEKPAGKSHPESGYEVDSALLAYRYRGRPQVKRESIALETTNASLNSLWSKHGNS